MRPIKPKVIDFEIYRPPPSTGKLKNLYHEKPDTWAPIITYKKKLPDIQSQLTPAQAYREKLQSTRMETRVLQRLEWRWARNLELWTRNSTRIKALYKGYKCRIKFQEQKRLMKIRVEQKLARKGALEMFSHGRYEEGIHAIDGVTVITVELLVIKARIQYNAKLFEQCESTCRAIIEMDPLLEVPYFLLSSSLASRGDFEQAYKEIQQLMVNIDQPTDFSFKLKGFLCTKIHPPNFREAVETYDVLVKLHPEDMNALLQRSCFLNCVQEWDRSLEDMNMVLYYQPQLIQVYVLRARVHCCMRNFDKAKEDYQAVLSWYPDDAGAQAGLADISQESEVIPLSDESVIYSDT